MGRLTPIGIPSHLSLPSLDPRRLDCLMTTTGHIEIGTNDQAHRTKGEKVDDDTQDRNT
jgi:hypothetical protein